MIKKTIIIMLLLLIPYAAAESISYSGWIQNTKTFEFDGVLYRILVSNNGNTLILNAEDPISLNLDQCYRTEFRKFCYNASTFDVDLEDYKAFLNIYFLQPDIDIERDVTNNLFDFGEDAEFTVVLTNIGDEDSEITYFEDFPPNVEIRNVKNAEKVNESVYWKGMIEAGDSHEMEYTVRSLGEIDQYMTASVKYYDGLENKEIFSDKVRLYSSPVLDIDMESDKEDYQLCEEIDFTINLQNEGSYDIDVKEFNITIPENINVVEKPHSVKSDGNIYIWDGTLEENESKSLSFTLSGKDIGLTFVVVKGNYEYRNVEQIIDNTKYGFLVHNEGVELSSNIAGTEYAFANELKRIYLKVKNKNSFSEIKNLRLNIRSDLPGMQNSTFGLLGVNKTAFLLDTQLKMPSVESEKSYRIKFNLTYETLDNQSFSNRIERTIVVKPISTVKIKPTFSTKSPKEEQVVEVSVAAENPSDVDFTSIYLKSDIPDIFNIRGATSSYFNLNSSEEQEVLRFTIVPSIVDERTVTNITFYADYVYENKEYSVDSFNTITISPIIPNIAVTKAISENSIYEGELVDVSYSITNNDNHPVYDIYLELGRDQNFDTLNVYGFEYSRLDPGETVVFAEEQLRAKNKDASSIARSSLRFKDKNYRTFTRNTSSNSISVEKNNIQGPALFVSQTTAAEVIVNQTLIIKVNLTNLGSEAVIVETDEGTKTLGKDYIYYEEITYPELGTYKIPKKSFDYNYFGNKARAYSNELTVKVIKEPVNKVTEPEQDSENKPEVVEITETIQTKDREKSFFARVYDWLKGLLTLEI